MSTPIDPQHFRDVLGNYPTGVSVITTIAPDGQALAMVVGTFTSVSLDPPLVAFLPTKTSSSFAQLREANRFVVNILAHDQEDVVRRLARSDRRKMDEEKWDLSASGNPVLRGVVAAIECEVHSILEAGDHYIVLGRVQALQTVRPTIPLLFFRGGYGEFAPKSFVVPEGRGLSGAVAQAQALRSDLEQAASEFGGEITIFARVTGDTVAVATAVAEGTEQITPLGIRYSIAPPIGAQYIAWSGEHEQDVWIGKAIGATAQERAALRRHLDDARRSGWSVNLVPDDTSDWPEFAQEPHGAADPIHDRHAAVTRLMAQSAHPLDVDQLDADAAYRVIGFMAPVFTSEDSAPELMVRLLIYPTRTMSGAEITRWGTSFKAFADAAGASLRTRLGSPATAP